MSEIIFIVGTSPIVGDVGSSVSVLPAAVLDQQVGFGDSGFWGFCQFIFVSDHFLEQISIFQSSFWFVKTLFYKFGFRNSISNFSAFIRDIKLDLFYSFLGCPPSLWVISQNSSPGLSNMPKFNQSKTIQVLILWPLFVSLDRESWVVYDLMRLSSVTFIK